MVVESASYWAAKYGAGTQRGAGPFHFWPDPIRVSCDPNRPAQARHGLHGVRRKNTNILASRRYLSTEVNPQIQGDPTCPKSLTPNDTT